MNVTATLGSYVNKTRTALAADKAKKANADKRAARVMVLAAICMAAVLPELAVAGPWDGMAAQVLAIFTGGLTRTIAIITIIACGIAAMAGKLSWDWVIKIAVGITLIFGGAAIVDYLIAATA
jgi:type IV secretory pathway VirB2 component (pilin)